MNFFSRYNPPKSPGIDFDPEERVTRDEFAEECDIHNILKKFRVTGVLVDPSIRRLQQPMFGDFTEIPSLDEFERIKSEVAGSFEKLPEVVREAFHGDPIIAMSWLGKATPRQIVGLWRDLGLDPRTGEPFKPAKSAVPPSPESAKSPEREIEK